MADVIYFDTYGIELRTSHASASQDYNSALEMIVTDKGGAEELFMRALAIDPEFLLAKISLARLKFMKGQVKETSESLASILSQSSAPVRQGTTGDFLTTHEASYLNCVRAIVTSTPILAIDVMKAHVRNFPRDIQIVIQLLNSLFFFRWRKS